MRLVPFLSPRSISHHLNNTARHRGFSQCLNLFKELNGEAEGLPTGKQIERNIDVPNAR
jgi:hypothetical protein